MFKLAKSNNLFVKINTGIKEVATRTNVHQNDVRSLFESHIKKYSFTKTIQDDIAFNHYLNNIEKEIQFAALLGSYDWRMPRYFKRLSKYQQLF